ncbi:dormancy-associated protein homolog 3-like isoform X1 [Rhododendron vialii]|uniref:dormancy-associated protein homolog 3-like isoform X1 n=1 Tax=Rhododendron vialii TaxID=182163 RepID=UPI00265F6BD2|nr:dormancy-associated protein homolog 3-like isoform X1 [Rhododendron vialii]
MSLLDQLWDDTIAGPRPDKGLGKLRKQPTFTLRALSSGKESDGGSVEEGVRVTRSIMIVKPPGVTQNDSPPVSPAGSTTPVSPFSGGREAYRFRRRSISDVYEKANGTGSRSAPPPPPYGM